MNNILRIITNGMIAIISVLAILLVGVRIIGLTPYTILSGSMEPTYHTGSVVYVKHVETDMLDVGDPITFYATDDVVATHRITAIQPGSDGQFEFRTKGDANDFEDGGAVRSADVIGKPVFSIPFLGYLASFLMSPYGKYLIMLAAGILAALLVIQHITEEKGEEYYDDDEEDKNAYVYWDEYGN